MSRLEKSFFEIYFETCALPSKSFLSCSMQRRDSLGTTTKIPRLSTGTTRKFKTRRSQSTVSSISDVFADEATTKGQAGLSVSVVKLRSEKNVDGNQEQSGETGQAIEALTDPFEEGEQTLIRFDYSHHADMEEPGEDFEREEVERTDEASERSEVEPREEVLFRGMSKSETKKNKWRKEQSSLVKQNKNVMMSSISPSEEQTSSKAKKSRKSLYDERKASLQVEGLSSSYDHPEITHPDVDFTPCPRNDMSRKALSASSTGDNPSGDNHPEITHPDVDFTPCPRNDMSRKALSASSTRSMSNGMTVGVSSTFDRLMMSTGKQTGGASLTSSSLGLTPASGRLAI